MEEFLRGFQKVLSRMLCFPMVTVAALNGHTYAGGCLFALAHDIRVANNEKGFMCMNEIDLGMPFTPGLMAVLREKIGDASTRFEIITVGKRFSLPEAHKIRLVDILCPPSQLQATAVKTAQSHAGKSTNRQVMGAIKGELYHDASHTLLNAPIFRPTSGASSLFKSKL